MKKEGKQELMDMNIHERLSAIQNELKVPKNLYNDYSHFRYRSCEQICESVKPILAKYGCVLTISDSIIAVGNRIYVQATATIYNMDDTAKTISVTAMAREDEVKKGMDGAQLTCAASSYARKYALNGLFCIDDTKDLDAANGQDMEQKKEQVKDDAAKANLSKVITEIHNAKDVKTLVGIWNNNKELQSNPKFTNEITNRKTQLK